MQPQISWRINFGHDILFWKDRWVPSLEPLQDLVDSEMIDNPSAKVSNYVGFADNWDLLRLNGVLPPSILSIVQALTPPSSAKGPDSIAWGKATDGAFTIAYAYNFLTDADNLRPDPKSS
ncbi:putative ribonuclease H protein [Sesbania bispinosa]|nr:putative ribonuclease H protein [Sesbania bispinosa]